MAKHQHFGNIYLLRHGETSAQGCLLGHTDVALSGQGWQQTSITEQGLPPINQCYSSPLQRCHAFAEQFTRQNDISLTVDGRISEMNFGDWDGLAYQSLWQQAEQQHENKATIGKFWQSPHQYTPPNGEAYRDFCARVDGFWQELLSNVGDNNILVVTHAGVIKHCIANTLGLDTQTGQHLSKLTLSYGSLQKISVVTDEDGKQWLSMCC